jgi:hypothetical protein
VAPKKLFVSASKLGNSVCDAGELPLASSRDMTYYLK